MAKKQYNRLRGRIVEKYDTLGAFADKVGISRVWMSAKLSGRKEFSAKDIRTWADALEIVPEEIGKYFFE